MSYFTKHWPENLHNDVLSTVETVFKARYLQLNQVTSSMSQHTTKPSRTGSLKTLICEVLSDSEDDLLANPVPTSIGDLTRPWRAEFLAYLETVEAAPPSGMSTIQWCGPGPSSLVELEHLDDKEVEVEETGDDEEVIFELSVGCENPWPDWA
ncbi:hypothetical protein BD769DRAFT_1387846 [Suillus cothurnatus]|nr:hypothetical protein BD769DRAFT_1387846 [Suillus cothurnatus]